MFYALSLSTDTSGARVVIRDWIESMLGDLLTNLKQYYAKIALLDHKGEMQLYPFWRLLGGAVPRRKNKTEFKRFHELLYRDLQRSAFKNKPLTGRFAQHVLMRCRAERTVRAEQAALLKLYLFDQGILTPTEDMMQADETTPLQPAYHCGRMLAVLESIQRRALPGIKATITDRYYGAASSSPATVFGTLVRGAQHHLSKLRRSSSSAENAAAWALENRLGEIAEQIGDSFPKYLNVEEQALFALGYYKQKAKDHRDALERKQQKEQAAAANSAQ
jgi:CRISPR-associated protein Csd1